MKKLTVTFKVLEDITDFRTVSYGGHFVFLK